MEAPPEVEVAAQFAKTSDSPCASTPSNFNTLHGADAARARCRQAPHRALDDSTRIKISRHSTDGCDTCTQRGCGIESVAVAVSSAFAKLGNCLSGDRQCAASLAI